MADIESSGTGGTMITETANDRQFFSSILKIMEKIFAGRPLFLRVQYQEIFNQHKQKIKTYSHEKPEINNTAAKKNQI
jgi:hypothetical protein